MILIKYILKNHLIPFLFSIFILISVFLLQFLMKFADHLVGKGLSAWIITKLIVFNLAWMVVLVVPMAVLIATLMAFGSMSQNNEIAILKATGISLYKMMIPPLFASCIIALFLVHFNNSIYPDANHAAKILMEDITRKKPTLSLIPGVFSTDIPNYSILVREIDQSTNELKQITIYDFSSPPKINIVTASHGKIYFSPNQKKLMMDLYNGEIHESDYSERSEYRKLRFERHKIAMPADQFSFEQSGPGGPRGDRELSAQTMLGRVDSLNKIRNSLIKDYGKKIASIINPDRKIDSRIDSAKLRQFVFIRVQQRIESNKRIISDKIGQLEFNDKDIDSYMVEVHKKYSLPFACIVFVLIGAPLGTMTRKGGFGMAAGISMSFFLIYWSFLIGGEKLADRNLISPFLGIWSANIFLGIIGIILVIKSARETITLDFDFLLKLIPRSWKSQTENNENN